MIRSFRAPRCFRRAVPAEVCVRLQAWDLGGSAQFRSEWGRYTRGCDVILFLVDTNDVSRAALRAGAPPLRTDAHPHRAPPSPVEHWSTLAVLLSFSDASVSFPLQRERLPLARKELHAVRFGLPRSPPLPQSPAVAATDQNTPSCAVPCGLLRLWCVWQLLEDPELQKMPLLVLGNKVASHTPTPIHTPTSCRR